MSSPYPSFHFAFFNNCDHLILHSFPTRRSSDLVTNLSIDVFLSTPAQCHPVFVCEHACLREASSSRRVLKIDRKSTRLNSSHVAISYAVFCLKKQKSLPFDEQNIIFNTLHKKF